MRNVTLKNNNRTLALNNTLKETAFLYLKEDPHNNYSNCYTQKNYEEKSCGMNPNLDFSHLRKWNRRN